MYIININLYSYRFIYVFEKVAIYYAFKTFLVFTATIHIIIYDIVHGAGSLMPCHTNLRAFLLNTVLIKLHAVLNF